MGRSDYKEKTENLSVTEVLFRKNEARTNAMGAKSIIVLIIISALFGLICCVQFADTDFEWTGWVLIAECLAAAGLYFLIRSFGYDDRRSKYVVLLTLILMGSITYFLYPLASVFIIFGPTMISIMYYSPGLTSKVTGISWLAFIAAVAANIILEHISPQVRSLHIDQEMYLWSDVLYTLEYYVAPRTAIYALEAFVGYVIAKSGRNLVIDQAAVSRSAALMSAELDTASRIQNASLPAAHFVTPDGNMDICAYMKTARNVGGDLYDHFMINDHLLAAAVGDVSDKGLPSAMYAVEAQSYIRFAFAESFHKDTDADIEYIDLEKAMNAVNRQLSVHNMDGMFVTMWLGCFDTRTGFGKYINAGHNLPYLRHADGTVTQVVNEPQFFMGAFEDAKLKAVPLRLRSGDTLVMYTDGATDARSRDDETFGGGRLVKMITDAAAGERETIPESIIRSVTGSIEDFIGEETQYDDITLMALHFGGEFHSEKADIDLETGRDCASKVIDFVNASLAGCSCTEEFRRKIDVIIDEVCSNISGYAYDGAGGPLRVSIHLGRNFISLRFVDEGTEFDPLQSEDPDIAGEPGIGGYGIYLVKNLADGVKYRREDGKNILTVYSIWNM